MSSSEQQEATPEIHAELGLHADTELSSLSMLTLGLIFYIQDFNFLSSKPTSADGFIFSLVFDPDVSFSFSFSFCRYKFGFKLSSNILASLDSGLSQSCECNEHFTKSNPLDTLDVGQALGDSPHRVNIDGIRSVDELPGFPGFPNGSLGCLPEFHLQS